jgi:hypothetical protein
VHDKVNVVVPKELKTLVSEPESACELKIFGELVRAHDEALTAFHVSVDVFPTAINEGFVEIKSFGGFAPPALPSTVMLTDCIAP